LPNSDMANTEGINSFRNFCFFWANWNLPQHFLSIALFGFIFYF